MAATPPPHGASVAVAVVSELHALVQFHVETIHDAVHALPRQKAASRAQMAINYATALVGVGSKFEQSVHTLPDAVRTHERIVQWEDGTDADETMRVAALAEEDMVADTAVAYWADRVARLRDCANEDMCTKCADMTGSVVTCVDRDVNSFEEPMEEVPQQQIKRPVASDGFAGLPNAKSARVANVSEFANLSVSSIDSTPEQPTQCNGNGNGNDDGGGMEYELAPSVKLKGMDDSDSRRFVEELEFMQSLANPQCMLSLANQGYFDDPAFIGFLQYLMYWRDSPPHAEYVVYPQALRMLEMLQDAQFRTRLRRHDVQKILVEQGMHAWAAPNEAQVECRYESQ